MSTHPAVAQAVCSHPRPTSLPLPPPAGFLPRARQTLLFSATMPQAVQQVAGLALKQQHAFIDTIREEDADTNVQVGVEGLAGPTPPAGVGSLCSVQG